MLFNSLDFALFFPVVAMLVLFGPARAEVGILLVASCVFYMAFAPAYILLVAITVIVVHVSALRIAGGGARSRKWFLLIGTVVPLLFLAFFRYWGFLLGNLLALSGAAGWGIEDPGLRFLLPIGISFYTFQALSYLFEVYHGRQIAERNFFVFSTFILFFPQLVAGPIERPQQLLPQFRRAHSFDYDRVASGIARMALGFFKKVVVADLLALYVNDVYGAPRDFNGLQLTLATVFFAYQIYCDFSGYSDIAVGAARVMGFELMENFRAPYHSASVGEFWKRWHISLSTWFRDYLYIPLGGSRLGMPRWVFAILVTFGVSGLWHGADWTFVVWGLLNGVYLLAEVGTGKIRSRCWELVGLGRARILRRAVGIGVTFLLTCLAWTVFRAHSVGDAWYVLTHFWRDWELGSIRTPNFLLRQMPVALAGILAVELIQLVKYKASWLGLARRFPTPLRWAAYLVFLFIIIMFGTFRETQFIYFQF